MYSKIIINIRSFILLLALLFISACTLSEFSATDFIAKKEVEEDTSQYFNPLESVANISFYATSARSVVHQNKPSLQLTIDDNIFLTSKQGGCDQCALAIVDDHMLKNGSIEIELSANVVQSASAEKILLGIVFHADGHGNEKVKTIYNEDEDASDTEKFQQEILSDLIQVAIFEGIYFTNDGRLHYFSYPETNMTVLGEGMIDLAQGQSIKIDIKNQIGKVYLNGSATPVLMINDLEYADRAGKLGLLVEPDVKAYYRNLKVSNAE